MNYPSAQHNVSKISVTFSSFLCSSFHQQLGFTARCTLNFLLDHFCTLLVISPSDHSFHLSAGDRRQGSASFNTRNDYVIHGPQTWACHQAAGLYRRTKGQEIDVKLHHFLPRFSMDLFPKSCGHDCCRALITENILAFTKEKVRRTLTIKHTCSTNDTVLGENTAFRSARRTLNRLSLIRQSWITTTQCI